MKGGRWSPHKLCLTYKSHENLVRSPKTSRDIYWWYPYLKKRRKYSSRNYFQVTFTRRELQCSAHHQKGWTKAPKVTALVFYLWISSQISNIQFTLLQAFLGVKAIHRRNIKLNKHNNSLEIWNASALKLHLCQHFAFGNTISIFGLQ